MKISVNLKACKDASARGLANVCFRVRDKQVDIKVVSEIRVMEKFWDMDSLSYRRNSAVPKDEQKFVARQIAEVIEVATDSFSMKANSAWLKEVIDDVLNPVAAYGKRHPNILARLQEYHDQHDGAKSGKSQMMGLKRKLERYVKYRREIDGEKNFMLYVETITLEDLNDFRDYVVNEHSLRKEHPDLYDGMFRVKRKPKPISGTTVINQMNLLCVFLHWCRQKGYSDSEAFLQYGCKTPVYGDPFFLNIEERNKLFDADLSEKPELARVRDIFVFHCFIGCRVGDLFRMTRDNVKGDFIEYVPQKTKKCQAKTVRVPLHAKAKAILARHTDCSPRLLPFMNNAIYNKGIKELLKHCGVDRMVTVLDTHGYETVQRPLYEVVTSHTARKTFIGNLYKKVPDPNLIASMSGHVEGSRAFKRYRKIDEDMKRKLVELIN